MSHETLARLTHNSVLGQLWDWFQCRLAGEQSVDPDAPAPTDPVVIGTGRLRPFEGETNSQFSERVARIKADVLCRALATVEAERARKAEAAAQREAAPQGPTTGLNFVTGEGHPWSVAKLRERPSSLSE